MRKVVDLFFSWPHRPPCTWPRAMAKRSPLRRCSHSMRTLCCKTRSNVLRRAWPRVLLHVQVQVCLLDCWCVSICLTACSAMTHDLSRTQFSCSGRHARRGCRSAGSYCEIRLSCPCAILLAEFYFLCLQREQQVSSAELELKNAEEAEMMGDKVKLLDALSKAVSSW